MNGLHQTQDKGFGSFIVIQNDLIGNFITQYGFWENHLCHIYNNLIKETDIVVDAGANIGFHTVQFAKKAKKVYSFEPQKLIFNLLSTNILFNNVSPNVNNYRLGLGDKKLTLNMTPLIDSIQPGGMENFGGLGLSTENKDTEEVDVVVFDDLGLDAIDVVKMDIQGSELYALKGMEKTLDRDEPWIMLENYIDQENDQKVIQYLLDKGYEIIRLMIGNKDDCFIIKPNKHQYVKDLLLKSKLPTKLQNKKTNG